MIKFSYHSHENETQSLCNHRAPQSIPFHIYSPPAFCHPQFRDDIWLLFSTFNK